MNLGSHDDFDLHTRLKLERGDLSNNVKGRVDVNDALVDTHFIGIPGLRTLTVRSLSGGDPKVLGRKSDRTLERDLVVVLVLEVVGTLDDISSD